MDNCFSVCWRGAQPVEQRRATHPSEKSVKIVINAITKMI